MLKITVQLSDSKKRGLVLRHSLQTHHPHPWICYLISIQKTLKKTKQNFSEKASNFSDSSKQADLLVQSVQEC